MALVVDVHCDDVGLRYEDSCPNARREIAAHALAALHEGWAEREVEDLAAALRKVERAYMR